MNSFTRLFSTTALCLASAVLGAPASRAQGPKPWPPVATFSILGYDPATGEVGGAVQSRVFAVGNGVLWAEANVGVVATQAIVDVSYGPQALALLRQGLAPDAVVKKVWGDDPDPRPTDWTKLGRQFSVMNAKGDVATYTGPKATEWAGHKMGKHCSAQGNILANETVVAAMVEAFENTAGHLSLRLLAALEAGQVAGGDKRGMQSAAMVIVKKDAGVWLHNDAVLRLQVDDNPEPIKELRRLVEKAAAQRAPRRAPGAAAAPSASGAVGEAGGTLAERIERITSRPEFKHALWGIEFYSLDTKQSLYALNADKLFTPGSTTKLLTEGTALATLGADYRFRTRVYRTGALTTDGTLDGDLVLVASGDPNLSGRIRPDGTLGFENEDHSYAGDSSTRAVPGDPLLSLRDLARQVAARVKKVNGRVIVDATLFREGDRELGTRVVMSPIVVNDNIVDITIAPGAGAGDRTAAEVSPVTAYVNFINQVTTGAPGSRPVVRFAADSTAPDGTHTVTMRGTLPASGPKILYAYAVPSPSRFAEMAFAQTLRDAGVHVVQRAPRARPDFKQLAARYTDDHAVAEHLSPPMSEDVRITLKVSQNLHASMTPLVLGAIVGKKDPERTGFDIEREFLATAGLDLAGAQQADGAGGDAHYTPAFMVSYLEYMASRPDYPKFLAGLPILGKDGTLWDIQPNSPAAGHVFAKTGTFNTNDPLNRRNLVTAKGLAGYMTTADGRHLAFAIYVNNVSVPLEADAVKRIVGQALGEVAAAGYAP